MIKPSLVFQLIVLAAALAPAKLLAQAGSEPLHENPDNGHVYQVVLSPGISWIDANSDANSRSHMGVTGHLATISSESEATFVNAHTGLTTTEGYWIGGFQSRGALQVDEDWEWVAAEGPIPVPGSATGFQAWDSGEPDEILGEDNILLQEDFLALSAGLWYSEQFTATPSLDGYFIQGYVVEYDVASGNEGEGGVIDPEECRPAANGCKTIPEQTLTIPASAIIEEGATIEYRSFRFRDPRAEDDGRCLNSGGPARRRPIDVFAELDPDGDPELNGTLILPEYLCGSPYMVVVKTKVTGVTINRDTILIENEKLADNLFECFVPFSTDNDPQNRDTVVWQSAREEGMLEQSYASHYQANIGRNWAGSVGELTNDCGSSRGEGGGLSYFVIGLHIDFGETWDSNSAGVFDEYVLLTRYKLLMLQDAVDNAEHVLNDNDQEKLRKRVDDTLKELDKGHYEHALDDIRKFLDKVADFEYQVSGFNHHGEHRYRGKNIEYILAEKIVPLAP